jgi:hypothetical protein
MLNWFIAFVRFVGLVFPELDLGPIADMVESVPMIFNMENKKDHHPIEKEKPKDDHPFWKGLSFGLLIAVLILLTK